MDTPKRLEWQVYGKNVRDTVREAGDRFGRYVVIDLISVWLLGALHEVKDSETGERSLLHVFPKALTDQEDFKENLVKVVDKYRSARDDHACLSPRSMVSHGDYLGVSYDYFTGGRTLCLHMEQMAEGAGLSPEESKRILRRLARALEANSAVNINHRTLTPENILINQSGDIRVYGFGWLDAIDPKHFERFVSGAILPFQLEEKAPGYTAIEGMSPESRPGGTSGLRADIYSLGLLGYYLLTHRVAGGEWAAPSAIDSQIKPGWDLFIKRCLEVDPLARPQNWEVFQTELDSVEYITGQSGKQGLLGKLLGQKIQGYPHPANKGRKRRLLAIGTLGVVLIAVGPYLYVNLMTEPDPVQDYTQGITQVGPEETANLVIRVEPLDATVRLQGPGGGRFAAENGVIRLRSPFRQYRMHVEAPGYIPFQTTIDLSPRRQELEVSLDLAWGRLRVEGPPGARVHAVSEGDRRAFLGEISENGFWQAEERLLAQTYDILVEKDGFAEQFFPDLELGPEWTELSVELQLLPAQLEVLSEPNGATVLIDGVRMGQTPLRLENLTPGVQVKVMVEGSNLRGQEETVELVSGEVHVLDFGELDYTTGVLLLTIYLSGSKPVPSIAEDIQVEVGDRVLGGDAQLEVSLRTGTQTLKVTHPDYHPFEGELVIEDGAFTEAVADLRPLPARLRVHLPDLPHRFLVDGEDAELINGILELPAERDVEVILGVMHYRNLGRVFHLAANREMVWEPELELLPGPQEGQDWEVPYQPLSMVWVPAGEFQMGSPIAEQLRLPNEGPSTRMHLSQGFWVGRTEVTQALYRRFMENNPSDFRGAQLPVDSVTWDEAMEFCRRLTEAERAVGRVPEGFVYRLPTEAEWEYFARAGTSTVFSFGDAATPDQGNFQGVYPRSAASIDAGSGRQSTVAVASFSANPWGLFDVHGNVREWTFDAFTDRLPGGTQTDFFRADGTRGYAVRGGGWEDLAHRSRSATRERFLGNTRSNAIGFRVVLAPEIQP